MSAKTSRKRKARDRDPAADEPSPSARPKTDKAEPETCSACLDPFREGEIEWLTCLPHRICRTCYREMVRTSKEDREIKCPLCRVSHAVLHAEWDDWRSDLLPLPPDEFDDDENDNVNGSDQDEADQVDEVVEQCANPACTDAHHDDLVWLTCPDPHQICRSCYRTAIRASSTPLQIQCPTCHRRQRISEYEWNCHHPQSVISFRTHNEVQVSWWNPVSIGRD
jgi:hypothetical protein